jgi:hypothetical protein
MDSKPTFTPPQFDLVVALLALALLALCLIGVLYYLRRQRRVHKQSLLPTHQQCTSQHRLTISATSFLGNAEPVYVVEEKQEPTSSLSTLPSSPVPEIRITFPDEDGSSGKRQSGRVVVLRIAESGAVGMEPLAKEQLPPYQPTDGGRFQSLDLDRIGGLKEKEVGPDWS